MDRRGILLAGGHGTRLRPLTTAVSKQLLPVYDKPMIYYALWTLLASGCREILVIVRPDDEAIFFRLLGHGEAFSCDISYCTQARPAGIAEALILGEQFLAGHPIALALGDNVLCGFDLAVRLRETSEAYANAVLACPVNDPRAFGVVELDAHDTVISIEEKPAIPLTNLAMPGLYFFDDMASRIASKLTPSARGELEITDVAKAYIPGGLHAMQLYPVIGDVWFDCGTPDSLLEAGKTVAILSADGNRICDPTSVF